MGKPLFMGVHGSADPRNAAMPFIMANGVVPYLGFILVSGTKPPAVEAN